MWLVLVTLAVAGCGPDVPAEMAPRLALAPCPPADNIEDGLCGTWEVFENRDAAAGRRITLRVVVLPALSINPASDPVFILAGGPGQAASELTEAIRVPFRQVNRDRDLVFVDQRGTGGSNPLTCELDEEAPEDALLLDPMADELLRARVVEQLGACVASLDADPRFYTTPIAMDDLDDVREALGYDTVNLWGGSYGTRAGLVFLRRHPDRVRTAILDGVAPVAMKLPLYMGMDAARARPAPRGLRRRRRVPRGLSRPGRRVAGGIGHAGGRPGAPDTRPPEDRPSGGGRRLSHLDRVERSSTALFARSGRGAVGRSADAAHTRAGW